VLNLIEVALLRANARKVHVKDIRQKANEMVFVLTQLNFQAFSDLCAHPSYKNRLQLVASAKEPTVRLRLATGVDSLKQSKIFIQQYAARCGQKTGE
jgi:hypothetical protein